MKIICIIPVLFLTHAINASDEKRDIKIPADPERSSMLETLKCFIQEILFQKEYKNLAVEERKSCANSIGYKHACSDKKQTLQAQKIIKNQSK